MNNKFTKVILLALLASASYSISPMAASASDFKTDEFYAFDKRANGSVSGLELINAVSAYEKGYTGAGVIVNVCDIGTVNLKHPEFSNKADSYLAIGSNNPEDHPTHVAGIIAAEKNDQGMHGVAFNSNIISSDAKTKDYYKDALANDNIKIISNSWDSTPPLDFIKTEEDMNLFGEQIEEDIVNAIDKDKLLVFASGNEGGIGPDVPAATDFFGEEFCHSIISVGALKSSSIKKNEATDSYEFIAKKPDGSSNYTTDAIAIFSNLHAFNEDNGLMAPGHNIYSTNVDFENDDEWIYESGTSMAAPVVSGVAALVQEAHPYLTGKQIGDVLLSTANKNIGLGGTKYFVTYQSATEETDFKDAFKVFYFGDKPDNAQVIKDLKDYFLEHHEDFNKFFPDYNFSTEEGRNAFFEHIEDNKTVDKFVFSNVHQSLYLGQGLVDASAAVNGLGAINVHRLTKDNASDKYSLLKPSEASKTTYAYYNVNTQGYNAEWSNNISEIRAGFIAANPLEAGSTTADGLDFEGKDADLKDLHDRYNFYANEANKNLFNGEDDFNLVDIYVDSFNNRVEESGLAGLSAGLHKEGAGCLTLSGDNTYKGTSVVTGGVLNITGSVTGDAWSDHAGVLSGTGTIKGSVMNNGTIMAGDYRAQAAESNEKMQALNADNNLKINGSLTGDGTILINGTQDSIIKVKEEADISQMKVQAGDTINLQAAKNDILFLSANNVNAQDDTASEKTGNFSYLLNYEVKVNANASGEEALLRISQNEAAKLDPNSQKLVDALYNEAATDQETSEFNNRLFALQEEEALATFAEQNNSIYADMAHEALSNRTVRTAVNNRALGTVTQDSENTKWWANMGKNWHNFSSANAHSFNITTGLDFIHDTKAYAGTMLSFSDNSISNNNASGKYKEYGAALYAGTQNMPGKLSGYLSASRQNSEVKRNFSVMSLAAESDYHSYVFGAGVNYTYDLQFNKNTNWHALPYLAVDYAHYKANSLHESGASAFGLYARDASANYADATLGMNFKRNDANATYILGAAYRRALTGNDTDLRLYSNVTNSEYNFTSEHEGRNGFILSAYADKQIGGNWKASASLENQWNKGGRNLSASVELKYMF